MLLIVQNEPDVPPGLLLRLAEEGGMPVRICRAWEEDIPEPEGPAVVLGGTMCGLDLAGHPFLARVTDFLRAAALKEKPLLGICLGAQLLARALGGGLHRERYGEKGAKEISVLQKDDPLMAGLPERFFALQFHDDSFTLPPGAALLAESSACPFQAFRHGPRAYGVQFHPEADRGILAGWTKDEPLAEKIMAGYGRREALIESSAKKLLGNFLSLAREGG